MSSAAMNDDDSETVIDDGARMNDDGSETVIDDGSETVVGDARMGDNKSVSSNPTDFKGLLRYVKSRFDRFVVHLVPRVTKLQRVVGSEFFLPKYFVCESKYNGDIRDRYD